VKPRPITRQRSEWIELDDVPPIPGVVSAHYRRVGDGTLRALVADEPRGLHLSISFVDHRGKASRYPRWDEIMHARTNLLPEDVAFAMLLPVEAEYLAVHDSTFHLHQHPERTQP
jgi:hypothetical protein